MSRILGLLSGTWCPEYPDRDRVKGPRDKEWREGNEGESDENKKRDGPYERVQKCHELRTI